MTLQKQKTPHGAGFVTRNAALAEQLQQLDGRCRQVR